MTQTRSPRQKSAKPPMTFADLQAKIKRPQKIAEIVLDAEAASLIEALAAILERMQAPEDGLGGDPQASVIAKRLQEAEERADASRVQLVFEAIPHSQYKALQAGHPPTAEQAADDEPFNAETFAPQLVKAQMIDPAPGTDEEFAAFWAVLSDGQIRHLWTTALGVQLQITTLGPRSEAAAEIVKAIAAGR